MRFVISCDQSPCYYKTSETGSLLGNTGLSFHELLRFDRKICLSQKQFLKSLRISLLYCVCTVGLVSMEENFLVSPTETLLVKDAIFQHN